MLLSMDENKDKKIDFDYIITLCDHAHETCPTVFSKSRIIHKGFDDPPEMAKRFTDNEEKLNCYRKVRDEIYEYVKAISPSRLQRQ